MKRGGDDYGSTLSLLNVQNGHLLLPLTCVLSILDLRILSQFSAIPGTSARSKLRFLSFCDQNPWKDVRSSIVFLDFVSMDDLTFS